MNFFEQQAKARSSSKRLMLLFGLAVVAIVLAIDLVVVIAVQMQARGDEVEAGALGRNILAQHPTLLVWTSLATLAVIGFGTLYKTASLRSGGGAVAREFGATLVDADTGNFAYRRLRNVVEEIAIASGVPVPEIYVLEHEAGINAFAAGYTPADAAVAVTRGALDKLSRDELQGVIAHEFSHVLNGDMRLNIRLMGTLFGILLIALAGQKVLENFRGGGRDGKAGAIVAVAIALMVIGYIGLFFGRLIKAGVSRQREFLADASAVQFTRQASGISGALKKIAALEVGSKLTTSGTEEVSHMLFGDGCGLSGMFATHPTLPDRIQRIDKRYDPREIEDLARRWADTVKVADGPDPPPGAEQSISGFAPRSASAKAPKARREAVTPLPAARAELVISAAQVSAQVGNPSDDDVGAAHGLSETVPELLRVSAYMQDRAAGLVLSLALAPDAALRTRQLELIGSALDGVQGEFAGKFHPEVVRLHPMLKLPLAALAFPALRRHPKQQLLRLVDALERVIHADGTVDLTEYCLATLVSHNVRDALEPARAKATGKRKLADRREAVASLLAVVAQHGNPDWEEANRAYLAGMGGIFTAQVPPYAPPADWQAALDQAWLSLNEVDGPSKALLVEAVTRAISHDGHMSVAESELLRTVCGCLYCPLPPMLTQQAA